MKFSTVSILILLASCSGPQLNWHGTIYVGSSKDQAVIGKKDNKPVVIQCGSPEFDSMVCTDDFEGLQGAYQDLLNKCEKWRQ